LKLVIRRITNYEDKNNNEPVAMYGLIINYYLRQNWRCI